MTNPKKVAQLQKLITHLTQYPSFLLISFNKTTHQNLEKLRQELKANQTNIQVIKNTLFEKTINKLAIKNKNILAFKTKFLPLKGATALITFTKDWSDGLNTLAKFMKTEKTLTFKAAILNNESYDQALLERLAQLPSKNQLAAKLIWSLKSPLQKLIGAIQFNSTKFVYILNQKTKQN
jgi:large subunit ribosomal protein L10